MGPLTGSKPGLVAARCRMAGAWESARAELVDLWRGHLERSVPYNAGAEAVEAYREEWARLDKALEPWSERNKDGEWGRHVQCSFDTTDRAAYDDHMRSVHGKCNVSGRNGPWAKTIKAGAYRPRLTDEGKPWKDPSKRKGKPLTQTCPTCGLIAEVDDRAANVLWWDEHTRGCALVVAS